MYTDALFSAKNFWLSICAGTKSNGYVNLTSIKMKSNEASGKVSISLLSSVTTFGMWAAFTGVSNFVMHSKKCDVLFQVSVLLFIYVIKNMLYIFKLSGKYCQE